MVANFTYFTSKQVRENNFGVSYCIKSKRDNGVAMLDAFKEEKPLKNTKQLVNLTFVKIIQRDYKDLSSFSEMLVFSITAWSSMWKESLKRNNESIFFMNLRALITWAFLSLESEEMML